MSEEKNQLTERQSNAVVVFAIFLLLGSFFVLSHYDPLNIIHDDAKNIFSTTLVIIYAFIGVGIGYIPIGITSIYERRLI